MKRTTRASARAALKPHFRASVNQGVLEIAVYEEIGLDFWTGGGVTADSVKQMIENAGTFQQIALRINSPGGDAFEGVAITSLLRSLNKRIDVYVDGIAASAASIIAMCGDSITMATGAMMMVHDAWSMCIGNDEDMRKMADTLERVSESIAQVYADRTGKPLDEVKALMDAETWMSAEECLANGFATAISKHADRKAMALASSFKCLAKLRNVPAELKAATPKAEIKNDDLTGEDDDTEVCACDCEDCMAQDCENCATEDCMDSVCAAAGCPGQETEEGDDDPDPDEPYAAVTEPVVASTEPEATPQAESNLNQYEARLTLLRGK